jgi:hypothetical protein
MRGRYVRGAMFRLRWRIRRPTPAMMVAVLALTLSGAPAALLPASAANAVARTQHVTYKRCLHEHLSARGMAGRPLNVTNLRVSRISCSRAAAAVRASTFEVTPAGPLFSTAGFKCGGPVGPPPPGAKPRYYHCNHGRQMFEFLVPGFS